MDVTFEDAAAFQAGLAARLPSATPPDLAGAVARGIAQGETAWRAEPPLPGNTALNLRIGRYFIRDDDLPVIEALTSVATAVAAAFATGGITSAALIPAISSLAGVAWNLWRKGSLLTQDQLRVYGILQQQGPCQPGVLVPLAAAAGVTPADPDKITRLLQGLEEVETRNGTVIKLASADAAGLWRAHAV